MGRAGAAVPGGREHGKGGRVQGAYPQGTRAEVEWGRVPELALATQERDFSSGHKGLVERAVREGRGERG